MAPGKGAAVWQPWRLTVSTKPCPLDKGCPGRHPASYFVPWGGNHSQLVSCRGCPAGMATAVAQREQRPWRAGAGRDPQPAQPETLRKLFLNLLGLGFSRAGRLRASAAAMGALQGG